MVKHIWSLICARALLDAETNNVSLIDVVEEIRVRTKRPIEREPIPFVPRLDWVTTWVHEGPKEESGCAVRDKIVSPSGEVLWEGPPSELDESNTRIRVKRKVPRFDLKQSGRYLLITEAKPARSGTWKQSAVVPLDVLISYSPPSGEPT